MRHLIVEDVNHGKEINDLFNEWMAVKTAKQHKKVMAKIASVRFGTYDNMTILDIIDNFNVKNHPVKTDFFAETQKAINNY